VLPETLCVSRNLLAAAVSLSPFLLGWTNHAKKGYCRVIPTDRLLVSEFFGIIANIGHTTSEANTIKNGLLAIGAILAPIWPKKG
jgi:hypothetical protein